MKPTASRPAPRRLPTVMLVTLLSSIAGVSAATAAPMVALTRDGTAVPRNATDDVGSLPVQSSRQVTYTVTNVGDRELMVIDVGLSSPLNGGCSVSSSPSSAVAVGASTTFTIDVRADAAGPAGCGVRIVSTEPQQLYSFTLRGTAASGSPEIEVTRGAQVIPNEGVADAVSAPPGTTTPAELTIRNLGTAALDVTATSIVQEIGATCAVTSPAAFSIAPAGATNVQLSIARTDSPAFSCKLEIRSNDADEASTVIRVTSLSQTTGFQVFVNDEPVESVPASALDDASQAIDPSFQTAHVIRVVNTGTADLFEFFVDLTGPCEESATDPFAPRPVFPSADTEQGVVNLFSERRGPLEPDICIIDIAISGSEPQHFYITIKRPLRSGDRGCSAGSGGAGGLALGGCAAALIARRRRRGTGAA